MGGCRRHIKFANDWTTSLCSLVLVPLTGSFSNVSCDMAHTDRNEVLLGVLAGLFVCIIFLVLSALRKAVSSTVSVGMLLFYELAQIIMYVTLFLQIIDLVSIPLLLGVDQTKDSTECTVHGGLYIYITLYYYCTTTLLAVETFLYCLLSTKWSLKHQKNQVSRRRILYTIITLVAVHSEYVYVSFTLGYGRNNIGCTFKGSNGPGTPLSTPDAWKFHAFPATLLSITLLSVCATFALLKTVKAVDSKTRLRVVGRMACLPILAFMHWILVILKRLHFPLVKNFPVRELVAFRGLFISMFLYVVNDKIRQYTNESICACFRRLMHTAPVSSKVSPLLESGDASYVQLDDGIHETEFTEYEAPHGMY